MSDPNFRVPRNLSARIHGSRLVRFFLSGAANRRTTTRGTVRARPVRSRMCYLCDAMAPTCDWASRIRSGHIEDHFLSLPKRAHKRKEPPNIREFLLELLQGQSEKHGFPAPESGTKHARDHAEPVNQAPAIGMNDRPTPACPTFVQYCAVTL